jgi:anti-sigma regulatory factor (Ser/Thr protein kinase)
MTVAAQPSTVHQFRHEAFLYREDADFVDGVLGFVRDGLERDELPVVVEPSGRLEMLRDTLGDDGADVRWLDMSRLGGNPGRLVALWTAELATCRAAGRQLRGVGEPAYPGRRPEELVECQVHELLLNVAFQGGPGWRLMCPYDERTLPAGTVAAAHRSHPEWSSLAGRGPTGSAVDEALDGDLAVALTAPMRQPASAVLREPVGPGDVPMARHIVRAWARSCGLPDEQVEVLELAASELVTNAITHGGGFGTVSMWDDTAAVILEISDAGVVSDALVGRRIPESDALSGAGLYMLHQLCDLLQLRSSATGTTVRVTTWR